MYVWNLRAMRDQLRSGPLTQREQFNYAVAGALFGWANAQSPFYGPAGWNFLVGAGLLVITGFAIYYAYLCNGGSNGERFLERYVALAWVLMIRFFVFVTLPLIALSDAYVSKYSRDGTLDVSIQVVVVVAAQLLFFWLLGGQLRAVSRPAI